jgi:predicted metalloprotease with PDZ domain
MHTRALLLPFTLLATLSTAALAQKTPIHITADLSEAPRKLYHAEIDLPVKPGPLTLTTPEWIPGNHRPTGPVDEITGVIFTANGKNLVWRRDDVDLYQFHVTIPAGVTSLHAHLDCIVTSRATDKMAVLEWEKLLLYPANVPVRDIPIQPSITVLPGWGIGTALTPLGAPVPNSTPNTGIDPQFHTPPPGATTTNYAATNVEQLEDSPAISGQYFHEFPLAPEISPKHYLDVVSDKPEDSNLRPAVIEEASNLVREASAAYASHHYNVYHFLLTLSDYAGGEGLEHGQSSDNGVGETTFAKAPTDSDLLAHEFTHSWNGKYRRPATLYQKDFATMQQGKLLWVYEGLTQYMGNVLAARSGFETNKDYLQTLASTWASLDTRPGRQWRSTEDTAIAASILRGGDPAWSSWRRGQDYYQEGTLLWLDVDTLIRKMTDNKKSLTDFEHIFLAKGGNTGPIILPYDRQELIDDLNQVVKYDWASFLHEKVDTIQPHADIDGIERGGYRVVYVDKEPASDRPRPTGRGRGMGPNVWYSLGLRLSADGTISDVRWGGPGDAAKLAPGQKITAINGQVYSAENLTDAIRDAKGKSEPIQLITESEGLVSTVSLNYHDGERFPVLERIPNTPAYIDDIAKPLAPQAETK